jgi:glycosyltransferase involved in cell wall biosynthesis
VGTVVSMSSDRPKVRFLLGTADGRNGVTRSVFNTAACLAADYEVEVIGVFRRRPRPAYDIPVGVRVSFLEDLSGEGHAPGLVRRSLSSVDSRVIERPNTGHLGGSSLWTDLVLVRALQTMRSGVLVTTRPELHAVAGRFAPRHLALVAQEHMHYFKRSQHVRRRVDRYTQRFAALVTLTERDRQDYIARSSWPAFKVHVIPNAARGSILDHIPVRRNVIVAAGRLTRQKGYDRLIEAFTPVAHAHPDWQLQIYGRGPDRRILQKMINERGIARQAELMGWTDQLDRAMSEASIFALSSRYEGLPLVGIEAMSKGLPLVAFDCPRGPRELVRDAENGYLVDNGDLAGFTAALERLVVDAEVRSAMGKVALSDALSYQLSTVGDQWKRLIADALRSVR